MEWNGSAFINSAVPFPREWESNIRQRHRVYWIARFRGRRHGLWFG